MGGGELEAGLEGEVRGEENAKNYPWQQRSVNAAELKWITGSAHSGLVASTEERDRSTAPRPADWRALFRNRSLMLLTISYGAVGYIEYLFFFWMRYYFKDVLHLGLQESRTYSTILFLAMALGMVAGGWLSDRLQVAMGKRVGRTLVPVGGLVFGSLLLVLGIQATETALIVTLLALSLASLGATEAPIWTTAIELGGRQAATAGGIVNTGGNLAGLIAPVLTPFASGWITKYYGLSEQAGWQWAIALGSLIGLLGAGFWVGINPAERVVERS